MTKNIHVCFLVFALLASACGKSGGDATDPAPKPQASGVSPAGSAPPNASAPAPEEPAQEIILHVNNDMKFDKTALVVKTGTRVHIIVKSKANMPTMPHNWVLVKPGTEADVALDGLNNAPDAGYVVATSDKVLAFTPLAAPGDKSDVTFTAPAVGTYPFICTVPGHYITMKGVLTVTP